MALSSGLLWVAPMSGYAVREAIRDVLGHFWSESFGQIYPALSALHRDGAVERRDGGRAGSSTYFLTPAGRARLQELLRQPVASTPPRNGLLLRLFFGHALGAKACIVLIEQARADAERSLSAYAEIRAEPEAEPHAVAAGAAEAATAHRPYWLLTVSAGEHSARATIAWADEALATLTALAADEPEE